MAGGVVIEVPSEVLYAYRKERGRGYGGSLSEYISDLIVKVWEVRR